MSVTTHPVVPEEVMALLDGELSPERSQSVSKHIDECTECLRVRDSFRGTSESLTRWTVPAVSERIVEQVSRDSASVKNSATRFMSDVGEVLRRRSTLAWGGATVAAAVLMIVFLGSIARHPASMRMQAKRSPSTFIALPPAASARMTQAGAGGGRGRLSKTDTAKSLGNFEDEGEGGGGREHPPDGRSYKTLLQLTPLGPMIARTVSLSLFVKDFDAGRVSLDTILARHSGYAASLNVSTPQGAARTVEASLRVPADQLDACIGELKKLGQVVGESLAGEEVTKQYADLTARLKNAQTTEARLNEVVQQRTGKVTDILEVERESARVRGEIEQMEAEQKTLEHRVEFATIDLKLAEEYKAQLNPPAPSVWMQLRNAMVNGFRNAFETLLGIVLFFAESGPTLFLWLAILAGPVWVLWRRYRRMHTVTSLGA